VGVGVEFNNHTATAPSSINGLAVIDNGFSSTGNLSGIRIHLGSQVKVRNTISLANGRHGIHVLKDGGETGDLSNIDLGKAGDFGKNLLQHQNAEGNINIGMGLCCDIANSTLTLAAEGNTFGMSKDCSVAMATLAKGTGAMGNPGCGGTSADVGFVPGITVDIAMCK
jgi:hypothetical protein